ncbi:MAG: phosphodiester glycosidase family protein [Oscillospiraceae bacterium]|nr:phosphodiester glycosidase family protein [Oscillospiraceae bacterium]
MYRFIKQYLGRLLCLFLILSLCISEIGAFGMLYQVQNDGNMDTRSTVSSMTSYTLMSGVTESTVSMSGGDQGYMLQIAPTAKASLKVSYSKYFTAGSSKSSRSAAVSKLSYSFTKPTAQAKAYETATSRNVIYAMNANFADVDTIEPFGLIKVEGNVIHPSDKNAVCYFAILKDGSYDFRSYTDDHSDVVEAVAGRQWLVRDGKQMTQSTTQISARSAIGIKADGTLVTFIVNGKTNSIGVTLNDMCELMYSLGCVDAINLDGGGSSLFATQRSGDSDLVIRNTPPDSGGERAVSSTLLLVTDPEADRLYFDFTNDVAAQGRYNKDIYGGKNFDTGNWHYTHTYSTAPIFDNTAGTMSFSTTADYPTNRNIHPLITSTNTSYTGGHPLIYVPTGRDYFKVRMKIEGSTDTEANFRLMYATDDGDESTHIAYSTAIPAGAINKGYFVLEGKLNFKEVDAITAIRPEVYNLTISDPAKTTVTFTYDYIYVGPESGAKTENYLLFDFESSTKASVRYFTIPYGFRNFDRAGNSYWATGYNGSATNFTVDNATGTLNVAVTDGYSGTVADGNVVYGPWVKTTNSYGNFTGRTTYSYFPLSFIPRESDLFQIRFKTEKCTVPSGTTPTVVLEYYYTLKDVHNYKNDIRKTYTLSNGTFQTLSVPTTSTFKAADVLKCFGLRFQNVKGNTTGNIAIDYIYIGPACNAPEPVHTWGEAVVTKEATCSENGIKTYTCSACKGTKTETIPKTAHSYVYEKIDTLTHKFACKNCDWEEIQGHSFTEGFCICGEAEVKVPVLDSNLKLSHSLNLASDISINFVVPVGSLDGYDMDTVYVESSIENYEGNTYLGTSTVRMEPVQVDSLYYFTLTGITAVQMNDTVSSVLYGEKDGQPYYSNVDLYSVSQYAYSQLSKANSSDTLKTLCADLLRYGANAQLYKEYRTSNLADENMTEAYRAHLSDLEAVTFGNNNTDLGDLANAPITWAGKTLDLDSKVCLKFVFNTSNYTGKLSDLSLNVSYKDIYGESMNATLTEVVEYNASRNLYAFSVDTLLASELREVVSVQICEEERPVSTTFQYSADTYGNNKTGDLLGLCKALFAYSDSAKAYFAS